MRMYSMHFVASHLLTTPTLVLLLCPLLQELEIVMGDEHISFTTSKIGSLLDCKNSK